MPRPSPLLHPVNDPLFSYLFAAMKSSTTTRPTRSRSSRRRQLAAHVQWPAVTIGTKRKRVRHAATANIPARNIGTKAAVGEAAVEVRHANGNGSARRAGITENGDMVRIAVAKGPTITRSGHTSSSSSSNISKSDTAVDRFRRNATR